LSTAIGKKGWSAEMASAFFRGTITPMYYYEDGIGLSVFRIEALWPGVLNEAQGDLYRSELGWACGLRALRHP
jgi:hypothetical protein